MTARGTAVVLLASLVGLGGGVGLGCGSKDEPPAPPAAPVVADAGPLPVTPSAPGITELPAYDPSSGAHLDGKEREPQPPPTRPRNRNARMLGIMLRSTPPGAIAAVDGQPIGPTPTYWEGEFTGSEREFTFALAKHAVARYRFVPTTNGVVHGRLEPIADRPGAGTPAIPLPAYPSTAPLDPTAHGLRPGAASPADEEEQPVTAPNAGTGDAGTATVTPGAPGGTPSPSDTPAADAGAATVAPSAPAVPSPTAAPPAAEPVAPKP